MEQANCSDVIGVVRDSGSGLLADVNWRRIHCTRDPNHPLDGLELCTIVGMGVCVDVRSSASAGEERLDLDRPLRYRPLADVNDVCVGVATPGQVKGAVGKVCQRRSRSVAMLTTLDVCSAGPAALLDGPFSTAHKIKREWVRHVSQ